MATEEDVIEFITFAWVHFVRGVDRDQKRARADYGQTFVHTLERPHRVEIKVDGEVFEIEIRSIPHAGGGEPHANRGAPAQFAYSPRGWG